MKMKSKKCIIFGAGEYYADEKIVTDGYVIAADAGYEYAAKNGIEVDVIVGDFDSAPVPPVGNIIRLNPVKDETDMLEAVNLGLENGCDAFYIYGATGGRSAHTFANIQTLAMLAKKDCRGYMFGNGEIMTVIHNGEIGFSSLSEGYVSAFSLCENSVGVSETGLKYSLDHYTMTNSYPIGVSNEFTGKEALICVENGTLLVIFSDKAVINRK